MSDATDVEQIKRVAARYALALDSGNPELLVGGVFTQDAVLNYDADEIEADEIVGAEAIDAYFRELPHGLIGMMHFVSNFSINVNGDEATSLCYYQAWHWFSDSETPDPLAPVTFVAVGCYEDILVRTTEGWRIRRRTSRLITPGPVGLGSPPEHLREFFIKRTTRKNLHTPGSPPRAAMAP